MMEIRIREKRYYAVCSGGRTLMTKTLSLTLTDCRSNRVSVSNFEDVYHARFYKYGRSDTALHSGIVKCKRKLHARLVLDLLPNFFEFCSLLNLYGPGRWEKFLGELKSGWEEVADHNERTACSVCSKKSDH